MKFFQTIDSSFIGRFINNKLDIISATDPHRIYVENVRSFYKVPFSVAKLFCEMASKEKLFKKAYAIECPNKECGRIITTFESSKSIPENITCEQCELLERDRCDFTISEFRVIQYYKLNKEVV